MKTLSSIQTEDLIKMKKCARCGEIKESNQFDKNQCWWNEWCMACKRTPIGELTKGGHV